MGTAEATDTARPVVRRGIVIVHGVGEQQRGEYIGSFVEPLAGFVADSCGSENVSVTVRNEPEAPAWATLFIHGDRRDEEWHIREAWWARDFRPSSSKTVLFWAIIAGLTIAWATWRSVFVRAVARTFHDYQQMELSRDDLMGRPAGRTPGGKLYLLPEAQHGLWVAPQTLPGKAVLDALVWLFICVLYVAGTALLLVVLVPLYLFLLLPLSFLLPGPVGAVQRKLAGIIVSTIGDQQAITARRFALAGASNEVAQSLWWMLNKRGLARAKRATEGFTGYETVTVVAHSGGCLVSFDALAGQVKEWLADPELPEGVSRPKRIGWITAGSGLNLAYRMRRTRDPREVAFWRRPLVGFVNWTNIYARYDPVPQGPPPPDLVTTLLREDGLIDGVSQSRPPYVCLRVVNDDFPASDHSRYWTNRVEVMSRVVALIADSARAARELDPQDGTFPATLSPALDAAIRANANPEAMRQHRRRALKRQAPMYLGILAVAGVLAFAAALGRQFLDIDLIDRAMPHSLFGINIGDQRAWLCGAIVGLFAVMIAGQLLAFLGQLASWTRAGGNAAILPVGGLMVALGAGVVGVALALLSRALQGR